MGFRPRAPGRRKSTPKPPAWWPTGMSDEVGHETDDGFEPARDTLRSGNSQASPTAARAEVRSHRISSGRSKLGGYASLGVLHADLRREYAVRLAAIEVCLPPPQRAAARAALMQERAGALDALRERSATSPPKAAPHRSIGRGYRNRLRERRPGRARRRRYTTRVLHFASRRDRRNRWPAPDLNPG
jgi:hypothetical protein